MPNLFFRSGHAIRAHILRGRTVAENVVKFLPPDGFFGIQTLQNAILGELTILPQTP